MRIAIPNSRVKRHVVLGRHEFPSVGDVESLAESTPNGIRVVGHFPWFGISHSKISSIGKSEREIKKHAEICAIIPAPKQVTWTTA